MAQRFAPASLDPSFSKWDIISDGNGKKELIGAGGFGKVFKAFTDKKQIVAVKIIKISNSNEAEVQNTIKREESGVTILKKICHPNIMQFLKSERTSARFCIFTELISGDSLHNLMQKLRKPFDESEVKHFSQQICFALNFLHFHQPPVLHRDIKCQNIMLTNEGIIKLIDFGLAKEIVTTMVHNTNIRGTWYYMAAELFSADEGIVYTPKTDVWAFGCTVFEMVTMQPPNSHLRQEQIPMALITRDLPDLPREVSDSLRDFYRSCVAREPKIRADTGDLLNHRFLLNEPTRGLDSSFVNWNFFPDHGGKKQCIGIGGFFKMYKAFTDKNQMLAVKTIKLHNRTGNDHRLEKIIQEYQSENDLLKNIKHKNIMQFIRSERTATHLCIFTELISGHNLYDLMKSQGKPFDEAAVRNFSQQICSALNFLHFKQQPPILHRDIKCSNIMLTSEGVIKLIDFSLAVEAAQDDEYKSSDLDGTWYFMAPELFSEGDVMVYTHKTDVWAFGCTVFEMITMQPPNRELRPEQISLRISCRDLPDLPAEVSASLRDFYRLCVARKPGGRADTTELLRHAFLQNVKSNTALDTSFVSWEFIRNRDGKKMLLNEGEFCKVYKVFTDKHQMLVVKICRLYDGVRWSKDRAIKMWQSEYDLLSEIKHQNIIQLVRPEFTADQLCFFTEFISGCNLQELMHTQKKPFDEAAVRNFSQQICSALNFLHCKQQTPIPHRDIQCQNIMLTNEGIIKLIGFCSMEVFNRDVFEYEVFTPSYSVYFDAPELFDEDALEKTPKTDVWAFGCTVFEMLTMRPPNSEWPLNMILERICALHRRGFPDLPAEVSADLRDFYRICVARDPEVRADTALLLRHRFLI